MTDVLFSAISDITGGLVNDLTTAMIAMVAIGFIVMGIDYLKELLDSHISNRRCEQSISDARKYKAVVDNDYVDPVLRDVYRARYKTAIRRASQ